jgi:uncharacterized membrane protein
VIHKKQSLSPAWEELLAELATAAYEVCLHQGVRGSTIGLQLALWQALRQVVRQRQEVSASESGRLPESAAAGVLVEVSP